MKNTQIHVVLYNAKLTANSGRKRNQRFFAPDMPGAVEVARNLMEGKSFGKDSFIRLQWQGKEFISFAQLSAAMGN